MKRFEYRIDAAIDAHDLGKLEEVLDELGEDGWQVVHVDHIKTSSGRPYLGWVVLMREVEETDAKES